MKTSAAPLAPAALALALALAFAVPPAGGETAYPQTNFAATHNSYSGDQGGRRGSIAAQLDAGVRFVELDINLGNYAANGDYQVGHGSPGKQVDHQSPNPASNDLAAWLRVIAEWSAGHPGHAPIALGLDAKNDLAAPASPKLGNLSALNSEVRRQLGPRLFTAEDLSAEPGGAWPTWTALQNRVLVILSGNRTTRERYRSDQGKTPAVAIDDAGRAVVVYQSAQSANLWYWSGEIGPDGKIAWPQHGKYDTGVTPAVATLGGVIVEVHKSENTSQLYSRVALSEPGGLRWGASQKLGAAGSLPSVAFSGPNLVSEIHAGAGGQNQLVTGTVDPANLKIAWSAAQPTSLPRHPTTTSTAGGHSVTVSTGKDSAGTADTLFYSTPRVAQARIVYPQLMFTEFQKGDPSRLQNDDLSFYACSSGSANWSWAVEQRRAGKITRMWAFGESATGVATPPNFPATDTPYESWYTRYCAAAACRR